MAERYCAWRWDAWRGATSTRFGWKRARCLVRRGHPFYEKVNGLPAQYGFEAMVEAECAPYYGEVLDRPSIESIDSERGIAWHAADSMALRSFLGYALTERLMSVATHRRVFEWVLEVPAKEGLLRGKTLGVDATTLEANAALRSIVRHDTGFGTPGGMQETAGMAMKTIRETIGKGWRAIGGPLLTHVRPWKLPEIQTKPVTPTWRFLTPCVQKEAFTTGC